MLTPARKTMPAIDYVSIVKSVYTDRRAMVMGALCCVLGVSAGAFKTGSPILWAIAAGFVLVAIYRYIDMTLFARAKIGPTDVDAAAKWEVRATYGANYDRLVGVKRRYDPDNLFRSNRNIRPR